MLFPGFFTRPTGVLGAPLKLQPTRRNQCAPHSQRSSITIRHLASRIKTLLWKHAIINIALNSGNAVMKSCHAGDVQPVRSLSFFLAYGRKKSVVDLLKIFYKFAIGGLAQLVEQLTLNQRVGGSNPPASTSFLICPRGDTRG